VNTATASLAIACSTAGVGLLRWSWAHNGRRPGLRALAWLMLCASALAWYHAGAAADKAVALAAVVPSLAALALVANQARWPGDPRSTRRLRRTATDRTPARSSSPGAPGPGPARIALAGPLTLAVALALTALVALRAPWSEADRLIAAGFTLPLAWAVGTLWVLMARGQLRSRLVAAGLSSHSVLGLGLGALIYLVCLSGTLCVLVDELKLLEQPAPAAAPLQPGQINAALAAARAWLPRANTLYVLAPTTSHQRLSITTYGGDGEHAFIATPGGGLIPQRTPFADFVVALHTGLTAPDPWGSLLVGIAGAALLALLISGVIAHPRIFRDAFRLRLNGSRHLREADLHNRLSVWGLPFHLAVTLTGALFGLANLAILVVAAAGYHGDTTRVLAPLTGPAVSADPRPAPLPDFDALIQRAQQQLPGSYLVYAGIERPGTRGMRIELEMGLPQRLPRGEDFYFDADGQLLGRTGSLTGSTGLQFYSGAAQVHFGFFGGMPVRIIYVVLGAALTFITATGLNVWFERQAGRGQPHPRLRGAWRAWTRGVPAALAISALASPVLYVGWTFLAVVLAAQALALWRGNLQNRRPRPC